ncbi:hypothetical protein [Cellulosimicrobium sp. Marseille-Q4280]|uniref:hypothetical protein n=1 Tax=Cellulosimicrobium sp. Marseille-Q4280 TaxID=2937992 RepID=UPI00203CE17E|nr:hypothetical protein [Cellulosimicrobium sp. Marseille-Q4280]
MAAPSAAGGRYVPGWKVATVGDVVTSRCTPCGWPHSARSADLATIARIDHEYGHRIGLYPPTAPTGDPEQAPAEPVGELVAA